MEQFHSVLSGKKCYSDVSQCVCGYLSYTGGFIYRAILTFVHTYGVCVCVCMCVCVCVAGFLSLLTNGNSP